MTAEISEAGPLGIVSGELWTVPMTARPPPVQLGKKKRVNRGEWMVSVSVLCGCGGIW